MAKKLLALMAILLFCSQAFAISAQDAVNFTTKQNNFLYSGEEVEIFPNTRIKDSRKDYWVVTVLSGQSLSGFIPVRDSSTPELPNSTITRRELIKTAYVLRYQIELNKSSSQQGLWLFDAQNVKFFSDLGQDLKNERIDLTTIWTSLEGFSQLQNQVDSLNDQLDDMYPLSEDISKGLLDATSTETKFLAEPDTNGLKEFRNAFVDNFDLIKNLESERSAYLAELDALRQAIALTGLPLETKQGLNSLANIPSKFQQFSSKATLALDLEEKLVAIFDSAQANVDSLTLDLVTREERNDAFQAMYGNDSEIYEETGQNTLSQLFDILLADEFFYEWENQSDLLGAKEEWEKAVSFFQSGSFDLAKTQAVKAKRDALKTYEGGLMEQNPIVDTDLLFTGVVLLIVAIILIYAIRNRDRLSSLISGSGEELEGDDFGP